MNDNSERKLMHYRYMHSCLIVLSSNYKTLKSELLSLDWTELEQ
jgi:hypothetical protein